MMSQNNNNKAQKKEREMERRRKGRKRAKKKGYLEGRETNKRGAFLHTTLNKC